MEVIYKYAITRSDIQQIFLPVNAEVVNVDVQYGGLYLWCKHSKDIAGREQRTFEIFDTGHDIYTAPGIHRKHIGTIRDGAFVWHAYEVIAGISLLAEYHQNQQLEVHRNELPANNRLPEGGTPAKAEPK